MLRPGILAGGIILCLGAVYLGTVRPGHDWGDDFGLYLRHARNLAEGLPYGDTGYVYNPALASLSPRTYPPVFPLLLAPVYAGAGLDLVALKVEVILLLLVFLWVMYRVVRHDLPLPCVLATLLLIGLNPYVWVHRDRLLSEIPFLLFTGLALLWLDRADKPTRPLSSRVRYTLLAGAAVFLAYGTRSIGIVLVPAVVLHELLRRRKPGLVSAGVVLTFALGVLLQRALLPFDGSYLDQLRVDPAVYLRNAAGVPQALGVFLDNGYFALPRVLLLGLLLVLAAAGYRHRWRTRRTACEVLVVLYGLAVVAWPSAQGDPRFLLPLLPLWLMYAWHGLTAVAARLRRPELARRLAVGLTGVVLACYAGRYTQLEGGPRREGIGKAETTALFDFVRAHTEPDAVLLFQKPRALALFTGRRASAHHTPPSDRDLWRYLDAIGATHVVVGRVFPDSHAYLQPFVARHPGRLRAVYANADFTVYRIVDWRAAGINPAGTKPAARRTNFPRRLPEVTQWTKPISVAS
jgi:hypothetical protein